MEIAIALLALWALWMAISQALFYERLGAVAGLLQALDARAGKVEATFLTAEASFAKSVQSLEALLLALQDMENLRQVSVAVDEACTRVRDTHDAIDSQVASTGEVVGALHGLVARWSEEGADLQRCYEGMAGIFEEFLTRVEADRLRHQALLEQLAAEREDAHA